MERPGLVACSIAKAYTLNPAVYPDLILNLHGNFKANPVKGKNNQGAKLLECGLNKNFINLLSYLL